MERSYSSPRWSAEIPDCSVPMSLDTYSRCSYNCLYCFSNFQRAVGIAARNWGVFRSVNPASVKALFAPGAVSQFTPYLNARKVMQWGGLSDPFDEIDREEGVTLDLLRFFREIEYPITFSTKATWWTEDSRYTECFEGFPWFNVKFSIIGLDASLCAAVERGVSAPAERLKAMGRAAKFVGGGVTLRLRPFIIGLSDKDDIQLIRRAADMGATAVSMEFMCLESRSPVARKFFYPLMSKACGFDVYEFYRQHSNGAGYMRLNRELKCPHVDRVQNECERLGLRFYVSDADFKERCHNGSCCGLSEDWNYSRGQLCEGLQIARRKGVLHWRDISPEIESFYSFLWKDTEGYNTISAERRASQKGKTMADFLRYNWNHPNCGQSPNRLFRGTLVPLEELDEHGDVVYTLSQALVNPS